jgi:hexulose-6-phosphate isomerase
MPSHARRIAFMQGRLSPVIDGKIQAFPWGTWREEFASAERLGFSGLEWTLDEDRLGDNPLMSAAGRQQIDALSRTHGLEICALTGDLFMQQPFFKAAPGERERLIGVLDDVLDACAAAGIGLIVFPLVDNGALSGTEQERLLARVLAARAERLRQLGLVLAFESDLPPAALAAFIAAYPADAFGLTYDIGNSAALGYDWREELTAYLPRIRHVHVKDRLAGGGTVALGSGNADLEGAIAGLERGGYRGSYTLQTARAANGDHAGALARYRAMTLKWMGAAG